MVAILDMQSSWFELKQDNASENVQKQFCDKKLKTGERLRRTSILNL